MTAGPLPILKKKIHETLGPLLPVGLRVALLEYPWHANVGDSAIWLGEIAFLRDNCKRGPIRTGDRGSYLKESLRAVRDLGTILLNGGGNLGDLWGGYLDAKIRILDDFPDVPIVQLPQSMHFQDSARFDEYRRAVARHPRFTLLVRDRASYELAAAKLDCDVRLCPDMALWLDLRRIGEPRHEVVCLLRTDIEASGPRHRQDAGAHADVPTFDWLNESNGLSIRTEQAMTAAMRLYPRKLGALEGSLTTFIRNRAARERLRRGCALLSSGRAVVTDRLHGHILCALMGIPHVVLDNSYGKLSRFHETWTKGCPTVRFAASFAEALATARRLAEAADER